ncbi:hypothetical protein NON20_25680 (plasmid) [Synechocystis sp. B12]|nr:hypothetical protein NON20_25680 [Synechocystis sp. B12]
MLATVRNRRGLITSVDVSTSQPLGVWHLVNIEYTDTEGEAQETLIWEHEPNAQLLEPIALPKVEETFPMPWEEFEALQRATRWGALSPFLPITGLEGLQDQLFPRRFLGRYR